MSEDQTVEQRLYKIVAGLFGRDVADLTPATNLVIDLTADSLDYTELVCLIEGEFDIEISEAEEEQLTRRPELCTCGEISKYVKSKITGG